MSTRKKFEDKILEKQLENAKYQRSIDENDIHIKVWTEALKFLPKEPTANPRPRRTANATLRPGSEMDKARQAILAAGTPLYIDDLLVAIGREPDKENRVSLGSSLQAYVRKQNVFNKPRPNTFGLLEFNQKEDNGLDLV